MTFGVDTFIAGVENSDYQRGPEENPPGGTRPARAVGALIIRPEVGSILTRSCLPDPAGAVSPSALRDSRAEGAGSSVATEADLEGSGVGTTASKEDGPEEGEGSGAASGSGTAVGAAADSEEVAGSGAAACSGTAAGSGAAADSGVVFCVGEADTEK